MVSLGGTGDTALTGGGRTQGVGNFLQVGGAGDSIVQVIDVGPFGVNGEEVRRDTHVVPATGHGESSEVIRRRDMGDARGGGSMRGRGNPVREGIHIETSGNRGAVGGSTPLI